MIMLLPLPPPRKLLESDNLCQRPGLRTPRLLPHPAHSRNLRSGGGNRSEHPSLPTLYLPEGRTGSRTQPLASSARGMTVGRLASSPGSYPTAASSPARPSTSRVIPTNDWMASNPLPNLVICTMGQTNDRNFAHFITAGMPDSHILGAGTGCNYFPRWTYRPLN